MWVVIWPGWKYASTAWPSTPAATPTGCAASSAWPRPGTPRWRRWPAGHAEGTRPASGGCSRSCGSASSPRWWARRNRSARSGSAGPSPGSEPEAASAAGQEGVAGEVAEEALARPFGAVGHGLDQQVAANEGAFPRRPQPAEYFFPVAPAAGLVNSDLEGLELFGHPGRELLVVSRY